MFETTRVRGEQAFRWVGKGFAILLALFWGTFFVEHLSEWFLGGSELPPVWVWVSMIFHFGMVVGLGLMVLREGVGSLVVAITTVAFFSSIGMRDFPSLALLNSLPIVCVLLAQLLGPRVAPAG